MSATARALTALRDLEAKASNVTTLARLTQPSFDEKWREVDQAVAVLLAELDDRDTRRTLEEHRRRLTRAAGVVSLHMAEPYRNPADRIRGWGDYWADLDAAIVELRHFLENISGSASTALGARHAPKTITVRLVLPDEEEEPPAPKRAGDSQ